MTKPSYVALCVAIAVTAPQPTWAGQVATDSVTPVTVVWSDCGNAPVARTNLDKLAQQSKPVLWFSRDEPLVDTDGHLPAEWPRLKADPSTKDLVYYRIRMLKASTTDNSLVDRLRQQVGVSSEAGQMITPAGSHPEAIATVPLSTEVLNELSDIIIKYMFYYPNELGTGRHPHDLESVELRLRVEKRPKGTGTCHQIRAVTLYGAAHGLGLYTNVLNLDDVAKDRISDIKTITETQEKKADGPPAPQVSKDKSIMVLDRGRPVAAEIVKTDPVWPLVVLVEEGKHASAPDRNGDGMFTPHYDVNKYVADAWGARDTMRSNAVAPVFRADTFKQRVPQILFVRLADGRIVPTPADPNSVSARRDFDNYVRFDYELRRTTTDLEMCGPESPLRPERERDATLTDYAKRLKAQAGGNPEGLLGGKGFCNDISVQTRSNGSDFFEHLGVGGQYNGFTRVWERFSGSLRFDGGSGWTGTVPIPIPVPVFGGVAVVRIAGPWHNHSARKNADLLYMPSASRFVDWYFGGGIDYGYYREGGIHDPKPDAREERGVRPAFELGAKFRFPIPEIGTFLGSRIAIRVNNRDELNNARLIFEVGAGIW